MIILCAGLFLSGAVRAQVAVVDPAHIAQSIANSASEMVHTSQTAEGMLNNFKETVKIYEQHREYFDKLRGVSNLVKNARKVKECILLTGEISELYVTSYERMLSDRNFSADELSAIAAGYARLLERSAALLLELGDVVNVTEMSMTDKDRLDLIGNVYDELKDCRDLTAYYTRKNIAVSSSRSREAQDMERFMALYGNDADRYW